MARKAKSIQTITDPLLEPFFITRDEYSFTVKLMITPDKEHFKSVEGGTKYEKTIGYYPRFEQALNKIAEAKLDVQETYNSIESYIDDYKLVSKQIQEYTSK